MYRVSFQIEVIQQVISVILDVKIMIPPFSPDEILTMDFITCMLVKQGNNCSIPFLFLTLYFIYYVLDRMRAFTMRPKNCTARKYTIE